MTARTQETNKSQTCITATSMQGITPTMNAQKVQLYSKYSGKCCRYSNKMN